MPKSYRKQNCCGNCRHVFVFQEYDEGDIFFCHVDKSDRPRCGSCFMCESWKGRDYEKCIDLWETWSEPRTVEKEGICDKWEIA